MDDESTRLTEKERRILAEIEAGLVRRRRRLLQSFRRRPRQPRRPSRRARRVWWAVVVLGNTVLAGSLWVGAVWAAAAGFVTVVVALSVVTADVTPAQGLARLRRLIGLGDDETPRGTS